MVFRIVVVVLSGLLVVNCVFGGARAEGLGGVWEIQEEDRTYRATLDAGGNGPYTHEGGRFITTKLEGRLWVGRWVQTGNDREGEFEVLLSEDGLTAEGEWWYTRVGEFLDIPPRRHGGSYFFRRLVGEDGKGLDSRFRGNDGLGE